MKKFIICLIFLISFANAIQCYNGKTYVDIPESKLSEIGYTEYNITHSSFDCKVAYKRYLKIKEIEPVNVSYVIKNEKVEEEPSKIGSLSLICLSVIIVGVIWLIKNIIKDEPQDEWNLPVQQEQVKPKNNSIQKEQVKPKNNSIQKELVKTKTAYELLLERPEWKAYRLAVLAERGEQCEWCGFNKNLQVHHKFYLKYPNGKKILPWEYNINCLLVLCKDCHTKAHKKYKIKSYYISY